MLKKKKEKKRKCQEGHSSLLFLSCLPRCARTGGSRTHSLTLFLCVWERERYLEGRSFLSLPFPSMPTDVFARLIYSHFSHLADARRPLISCQETPAHVARMCCAASSVYRRVDCTTPCMIIKKKKKSSLVVKIL